MMDVITEDVKDAPQCSMMLADDIVLCGNTREKVETKTEDWRRVMEERGLKVSRKKAEYMAYNEANDDNISMQDYVLKKVTNFKYLGSSLNEDGELDEEVEKSIQADWRN